MLRTVKVSLCLHPLAISTSYHLQFPHDFVHRFCTPMFQYFLLFEPAETLLGPAKVPEMCLSLMFGIYAMLEHFLEDKFLSTTNKEA